MSDAPPDPQYADLREQVEGILAEGKAHSRRAGEGEKIETYWHIGDALDSHVRGQARAEYCKQVVLSLSRDLNLTPVLLWDMLLFRRSMPSIPILHARVVLTWTHYRRLIHLPTQAQRRFYERRATQESWSVRQLERAIRADAYSHATDQPWAVPPDEDPYAGRPLKPAFGQLHTYGLVPSGNPAAPALCLDLGFQVTYTTELTGLENPRPGTIVTASEGHGGTCTFTRRPPGTGRYTYLAWVDRVIDGDTLVAVADLGLGHQTRPQRFRLRGIDCPELSTQAGRNARDFVQAALDEVDFVILATHRTDAYGRYLADVRYLPGEPDPEVVRRRGIYLNRQLLDEHLAVRYLR